MLDITFLLKVLRRCTGKSDSLPDWPVDHIFITAASERVLFAWHGSAHARHHVSDRAALDQHLHFARTDFFLDGDAASALFAERDSAGELPDHFVAGTEDFAKA